MFYLSFFDLGGSSSGLDGQCYWVVCVAYDQAISISFVGCPLPLEFAASSLLIISNQWILRILCKHRLIKVWIFFIDALVVRHVSAPYNNTDLTFELNKCMLVDLPISLELQTFFSMLNADHALPILVSRLRLFPHFCPLHCPNR